MDSNSTVSSDVSGVSSYESPFFVQITYGCLASLGILGNGLVLVVMSMVKELRDFTNLLIANQSLIDLFSSLFLMLFYVVPGPELPQNNPGLAEFLCTFWKSNYLFWSCIYASSLNLVVLTMERYIAVVRPIVYKQKTTRLRGAVCVLCPWVISFSYQISSMVSSSVVEGQCILIGWPSRAVKITMGVVSFNLVYLIPLITMAVVYTSIEKALRRRVGAAPHAEQHPGPSAQRPQVPISGVPSRIPGESTARPPEPARPLFPNQRQRARRNVIRTLLTVILCYAVCWTPNQVVFLYYNLGGYLDFNGALYYVTVFLAFGNMCINPIIYTLRYHKFQKALRKVFRLTSSDEVNSSTVMTAQATTVRGP